MADRSLIVLCADGLQHYGTGQLATFSGSRLLEQADRNAACKPHRVAWATERVCRRCGVYADVHDGRCPRTVGCPHCHAVAGDPCIRPDGSEMAIGSHARRGKEVRRG